MEKYVNTGIWHWLNDAEEEYNHGVTHHNLKKMESAVEQIRECYSNMVSFQKLGMDLGTLDVEKTRKLVGKLEEDLAKTKEVTQ